MAGTPAPRQAHFATRALRGSLRSVRALAGTPVIPAPLAWLTRFARSRHSEGLRPSDSPTLLLNGGDPCTPPSSLRYASPSPLAPLPSRAGGNPGPAPRRRSAVAVARRRLACAHSLRSFA